MEKLMLCDCGGQAKVVQYSYIKPLYLVQCERCGESVMKNFSTKEAAIKAWNKKVEDYKKTNEKTCLECRYSIFQGRVLGCRFNSEGYRQDSLPICPKRICKAFSK